MLLLTFHNRSLAQLLLFAFVYYQHFTACYLIHLGFIKLPIPTAQANQNHIFH